MPLSKTKITKSEVSVEIDLEKLLGGVSKNQAIRETFFQMAFDKTMERLSQGRDRNNKVMAPYSKSYKESLAYKVFGKDGTVNMQLTGDMINSMFIKEQNKDKMTIGFQDDLSNAKAYAHMTGFKGHPTLQGKVKPREFFGWSDKELQSIATEIKPQINVESIVSDLALLKLLDKLVG